MKNYLKKLKIIAVLISVTLISACKFPDNTLDWQNINGYKPEKLKFGTTTIDDFYELAPDANPEYISKNITVINAEPDNNDIYKKIRVGFKDKKLDWIEFGLIDQVEIAKFTRLYGKPQNINTTYSKKMDYYDYGFFNIATDKKHSYVKSINLFETPDEKLKPVIIDGIPSLQDLVKANFLNLKPGLTLETSFNDKYPDLAAQKKNKFDKTSLYILENELGGAKLYYKKIIIVFNNGLLSWINFIPQDFSLEKALKLYGTGYKTEPAGSKCDFYEYANILLLVDRTKKKVIDIGIISPKNEN